MCRSRTKASARSSGTTPHGFITSKLREGTMAYDLLIKNGMVVDGTGFARYRADVAVKDGIIAEIGKVKGAAETTIDADGLFVAPGIIDLHTHYDAQPYWDKLCTSSIWHGVTSVLMGNCGLT